MKWILAGSALWSHLVVKVTIFGIFVLIQSSATTVPKIAFIATSDHLISTQIHCHTTHAVITDKLWIVTTTTVNTKKGFEALCMVNFGLLWICLLKLLQELLHQLTMVQMPTRQLLHDFFAYKIKQQVDPIRTRVYRCVCVNFYELKSSSSTKRQMKCEILDEDSNHLEQKKLIILANVLTNLCGLAEVISSLQLRRSINHQYHCSVVFPVELSWMFSLFLFLPLA